MKYKDIFGKALIDYYKKIDIIDDKQDHEDILTWTNISEVDTLPLPYLFRDFEEMPPIEQKALKQCYGRILDVGCGAGVHSLYLQEKGFQVKGIDISAGAVRVSKSRKVKDVQCIHLLNVKEKFDTILLLMNGTGIFQELKNVGQYLTHLKSLLHPTGQILIDSSDIKYMYNDDLDINNPYFPYYGELDYFISYKGEREIPMKWLYLDFKTLKKISEEAGLTCKNIMNGEHYDYLARISISKELKAKQK